MNKSNDNNWTLEYYLWDHDLLNDCSMDYNNARYSNAVFNAMRYIESKARTKAGANPSDNGQALFEKVFSQDGGLLNIPFCKSSSEKRGFVDILKGMYGFHRNPKSHHNTEQISKEKAFKIICYLDYISQVIDTAQPRN